MKPPLTYYGGKQNLSKQILSMIPKHKVYCEPFFGGGAIFFAKEPSKMEVINDTNGELINFYKVLKTKFRQLEREIKSTLHSREEHKRASVILANPFMFDEIQRAWAIWTMSNQSFGSQLNGSWGYDKKENKSAKQLYTKRSTFTKHYSERLEKVQIECKDAIEVIKLVDSKDTFFYCDPPYFNSNMGHYKGYIKEDFERLLQTLSNINGKFLLSSYPSLILDKYIKANNWTVNRIEMKLPISAKETDNVKKKEEVLTANFLM
ncbi:MAG TPA: DNA adenine methylase [Bacteroidia bacterium]|nr:DNA adenine methylase [Bacteroidia bacterium]HRH09607.1 DNA adenine methylase [Bacteroidia bacterium]